MLVHVIPMHMVEMAVVKIIHMAVMANPDFQVTDKDGKFDLKNPPPGTYTVVAWHELYGASDPQTVTIGSKETKNVSFTFKAAAAAGD